jgi:O-antigen/teichoic acid export membrane protein
MQAAVQGCAFLSAVLVVRLLSIEEYAYYTIANAALGTLTVLTDCGIGQGVLSAGGRVWQSREALGGVLAAGMTLRRKFGLVAAAVSIPGLFYLLREQGASYSMALLVALSIIPTFLSTLSGHVLEVVPRLHQRLLSLQRIQLDAAGARLLAVASAVAMFPHAWLASIAAGLAQSWSTWRTRRLAREFANTEAAPDASARASILQQVRHMAPNAVFYAFSGQITMWLISMLGNTEAVAHVGALTRLAAVFNVLNQVFTLVFVPRFARMPSDRDSQRRVMRRFWQIQLGMLVSLALIVGWVGAFPGLALAVLGPAYAELTREVALAAGGAALSVLSGSAYVLSAARGVVAPSWFVIPVALIVQVALIATLPMSTARGVLWLGLLTNLTLWLIYASYFWRVRGERVARGTA